MGAPFRRPSLCRQLNEGKPDAALKGWKRRFSPLALTNAVAAARTIAVLTAQVAWWVDGLTGSSIIAIEIQLQLERRHMHWLKRLGMAGFLFFLIKGLLWLCVPAVILLLDGCQAF